MPLPKVAAVMMAYNELDFAPIWAGYYAAQVGPEHCYIIDHGSDDGSTDNLGIINIVRLPRSPLDEGVRARYVSEFCADLLHRYDFVIHADADEILVADPTHNSSLKELCASTVTPIVTAMGFNVHHYPDEEPAIDLSRLVSEQRSWVQFVAPMCKPAIISEPVNWSLGFHSCDARVAFGKLFLFHLRGFDLAIGLRRLQKTRALERANSAGTWYQQITDQQHTDWGIWTPRVMPKVSDVSFNPEEAPLKAWLDGIVEGQDAYAGQRYKLDLERNETSLWHLHPRFVGTF